MNLNNLLTPIADIFKSGALDFLEEIDEETVSPIALLLNVDEKLLISLLKVLPSFFKGDVNLKEIIALIIPIVLPVLLKNKFKTPSLDDNQAVENIQKPTYSETFGQNKTASEDEFPLADNDIIYSLNSYFNSFNAS